MRVTKRIEEYVRDEVRKISACKEAAIRERYQPEFDALEAFKEAIVKSANELGDTIQAEMQAKGYKTSRYCENVIQTCTCSIYTPAKKKWMMKLQRLTHGLTSRPGSCASNWKWVEI